MKINYLIICLLLPLFCLSQEPSTIQVQGRADFIPETLLYKATMTLSKNRGGTSNEAYSIMRLKELYNEALQIKGFSLKMLKEDVMGYKLSYTHAKGVKYTYTTNSLEQLNSFIDVKSIGLERLDIDLEIKLTKEEAYKINKEALKNAKIQAEILANAMGRQLGEIDEVIASKPILIDQEISVYLRFPLVGYTHYLSVTYNLK